MHLLVFIFYTIVSVIICMRKRLHMIHLLAFFFFLFKLLVACSLDHGEIPWVQKVPSAQGQGRTTIYIIITHTNTKEKVFVHHKQSRTQFTSRQ